MRQLYRRILKDNNLRLSAKLSTTINKLNDLRLCRRSFNYDGKQFVNIGVGEDVSIKELAESVKKAVSYKGELNLMLQSQMVLQAYLNDISCMLFFNQAKNMT